MNTLTDKHEPHYRYSEKTIIGMVRIGRIIPVRAVRRWCLNAIDLATADYQPGIGIRAVSSYFPRGLGVRIRKLSNADFPHRKDAVR